MRCRSNTMRRARVSGGRVLVKNGKRPRCQRIVIRRIDLLW